MSLSRLFAFGRDVLASESQKFADNKGGRNTGVDTRDAIRWILRREDRWRRRGGMIILKALLNKKFGSAPNATSIAAAQSPAVSNKSCTSVAVGGKAIIDDAGFGKEKTIAIGLGGSTTDCFDANGDCANDGARPAGVHAGKKAASLNGVSPPRFTGSTIVGIGDDGKEDNNVPHLAVSVAKIELGVTTAAASAGACPGEGDARPPAVVHADWRYSTYDDDGKIRGGRVRPRGGDVFYSVSREKRGRDGHGDALDGGPGAAEAEREGDSFACVLAGLMDLVRGKEVVFHQIVMFL